MINHVLLGCFLVAHGLAQPLIPLVLPDPGTPFDTSRSWLLNRIGVRPLVRKRVAMTLAGVAGTVLILGGIALVAGADWWRPAALLGAALSLVFLTVYFHVRLLLGVLLDVAFIWIAATA